MKLDDLVQDPRTSLSASIKQQIDQGDFRRDIAQLQHYHFWADSGKKAPSALVEVLPRSWMDFDGA